MKSFVISSALMALISRNVSGSSSDNDVICISPTNQFTMKVNLYAGELGYYTFDECGDTTNPTIGMTVGEVYTFDQSDNTNYYHPVGFAYFPDGAHDGVDELEPGVAQGSDLSCANDLSCPAPMYFRDGVYQGIYSNIASELAVTTVEDDFGLDVYEPLFFRPLLEWEELGPFTVKVHFDDTGYDEDIFYFCHIHQYMTGRIKLLDSDGDPISADDTPAIPTGYYDEASSFDESCGTFGLGDFQVPNFECPERFVCDAGAAVSSFASCIEAMDCAMIAGMTTNDGTADPRGLFIYQMIPHHQNAVNMAKALLNTFDTPCADLSNEEDPQCVLEVVAREIIVNQNFQIQVMRGILEGYSFEETDDCVVEINPDARTDISTDTGGSPERMDPSAFLRGMGFPIE